MSSDHAALVAFYRSTGGTCWTNRWEPSAELTDFDDDDNWRGVAIFDDRVAVLELNDNNLEGIPLCLFRRHAFASTAMCLEVVERIATAPKLTDGGVSFWHVTRSAHNLLLDIAFGCN